MMAALPETWPIVPAHKASRRLGPDPFRVDPILDQVHALGRCAPRYHMLSETVADDRQRSAMGVCICLDRAQCPDEPAISHHSQLYLGVRMQILNIEHEARLF